MKQSKKIDPYYEPLRNAIVSFLEVSNLSQAKFAKKLGISAIAFNAIIHGRVKFPSIGILYDLHKMTGISFYYDRKNNRLGYLIPERLQNKIDNLNIDLKILRDDMPDMAEAVEHGYRPLILTDTNANNEKSD